MSFLSSLRSVLILGDEGLQIYSAGRLGAKFIDFVAWDDEGFEASVRNSLVNECKRKPVVILNDMVEQHYRKERIPNVSILDKASVLKRRLNITFPNYKVRAALKLKEQKKKSPGKNEKGTSYLFAATPASDAFNKTLAAIDRAIVPIIGFYLLPIEAATMVKDLSAVLSKKAKHKSLWTMFVGQHHNGGLRQIVVRDGELALTRITPIVDTDVEPELWAKEVSGEIDSTMSYLSRLGYSEMDGLDIVVIANDSAHAMLESIIKVDCNFRAMTSMQVAGLLGISLGRQEDLRYADPLHAAYLGGKKRFRLPMQSVALQRLTQPRRIASALLWIGVVGCILLGVNASYNFKNSKNVRDNLDVKIQVSQSLQQEYDVALQKKKALGFDFLYVSSALNAFKDLQGQKLQPLPVISAIGKALGAGLKLDSLKIKLDKQVFKPKQEDQYAYIAASENKYEYFLKADLIISFPGDTNPDLGVSQINGLQKRLQKSLPDYTINIERQVADLSYTGNFVGGGADTLNKASKGYSAELTIRGILK